MNNLEIGFIVIKVVKLPTKFPPPSYGKLVRKWSRNVQQENNKLNHWVSETFMEFMLKEGLVKRGIVHDK